MIRGMLIVTIVLSMFLSACEQASSMSEETNAIKTDTLPTCVMLLSPESGSEVPIGIKVPFVWTPLDGANTYQLNLILPSGETVTLETDRTSRDRYLEVYKQSGEFRWSVTALNADGQPICRSDTLYITKLHTTDNGTNGCGSRGLCPDWSIPDLVTGCEGN